MVQVLRPYVTKGKPITLTIQTFVSDVMSLLFSRLFHVDLSWLFFKEHFMVAVTICSDFGAQENKICHYPLFPHLFVMK